MGFSTSHKNAIFFIGIAMVLFTKSESKIDPTSYQQDKPNEQNFHIDRIFQLPTNSIINRFAGNKTPTPLEPTSTPVETVTVPSNDPMSLFISNLRQADPKLLSRLPKKQVKCEPLRLGFYGNELVDFLSPEIFSQANYLRYFVDKTTKLQHKVVRWVRQTLNEHLQKDELPRCYVPYAKALSSFLRCWQDVDNIETYMSGIRILISKNDADLSFLPSNISLSPQLLQLFSGEIFGDPIPPQRIFYKLVELSKNDLWSLKTQLQKFSEEIDRVDGIPLRKRYYIWYANAVKQFLQNESAIDDLKRDMAVIQRLATTDQPFSPHQ